jgi:glutamate-5-semialdehyde dehydrogenase
MTALADETARLLDTAARAAREAAHVLAAAPRPQKDMALTAAAAALRARTGALLAANGEDLAAAEGLTDAYRDRLTLTPARIEAMAKGLEEVAALPDRSAACWPSGRGPTASSSAASPSPSALSA